MACCNVFDLLICCDRAHVTREVMTHRFFCGPHAKKSAALAKQQKKKPKGKGKGKTVEESGENSPPLKPVLRCALLSCKSMHAILHFHTE